jgi:hypothetical protein
MSGGRIVEIEGHRVLLPVHVRDASQAEVYYHVPVHLAHRLVPQPFEPVNVGYGNTQAALFFVEYRDTDLDPYDEVGLAFAVRPVASYRGDPGLYISMLTVTETFSVQAGRGIWGWPKTLARIEIAYHPERASCRLVMEGRRVLSMAVPRPSRGTNGEASYVFYSLLGGRPVTARSTRWTCGEVIEYAPISVGLELGDHPLAEMLRELGLPMRPFYCRWIEQMRVILHAPEPLERANPPAQSH